MQLNSFVQADKVLYLFQRKTPFLLPVCQGQAARGPLNMGEQPPQQFFELFYGHGLHNVMQSVQGKGFDGKIPAGGQERAGKPGDQAAQNASRFPRPCKYPEQPGRAAPRLSPLRPAPRRRGMGQSLYRRTAPAPPLSMPLLWLPITAVHRHKWQST